MKSRENEQHSFSKKEVLKALLIHLFRHNLGYKLLAVVLAVVLWAALITQDPTLTREKIFTDVSVTVSGSDTMKRNGYIVVSDLTELLQDVTVRVDVPQRRYEDASVSTYSIRLDLSRLSSAGVHEVRIQSTDSTTYGSVTEISPATIPVEVEEYITRYRIPVSYTLTGSVQDGWYAESPTVSPTVIAVSGPKSLVDSIARAAVTIDLSTLPASEDTVRTAVPFTLIDRNGNTISSDLLSVTSEGVRADSVIVEQHVYPTQSLELSPDGLITGTPAAGYEVKSVTFSPAVITAAGPQESLSQLDTLFASSGVDVSGCSESLVRTLSVRKPTDLVSLSPGSVTVQIEIGPVIKSRTFTGLRINADGCDTSCKSSMSLSSVNVTVTGPQLWVNSLKSSMLRVSCDLTGLTEGTYQLPLTCTVDADESADYQAALSSDTVTVTLKAK